jgi:hypothetical protein
MIFPLSISDVSLWLAVMAIVLLITSELYSSHGYAARIALDKSLFVIAHWMWLGFMVTVVMRVVGFPKFS